MSCPFMEEADARCAAHFCLPNLSQTFTHCVGRWQGCEIYQRLLRDRAVAIRGGVGGASHVAGPARVAV